MKKFFVFKNLTKPSRVGIVALLIIITAIISASIALYIHTERILANNIKDRLLSVSITTASNISADDIASLKEEADWQKPEWARVVNQLHNAKYANKDIVFMYILRQSETDPTKVEFVADADSIDPYANLSGDSSRYIDANRDGKIEPYGSDMLQWPGQPYPEASSEREIFEAFLGVPVADERIYTDSFGSVLSGYAPIKDEYGKTIAILGTDIKASDFWSITKQTFGPFLIFTLSLLCIILILTITIISSWEKHRRLQETSEDIYKHSLEIAVKNKTLALLEKLYQISILTLTPEIMAKEISNTIRGDLNMEFAGVLLADSASDSLLPVGFSKSERMGKMLSGMGFLLKDIKIIGVKNYPFWKQVVYEKKEGKTNDIEELWSGLIEKNKLEKIKNDSHIKTVLLLPLLTNKEVLGVLILGLNKDYETLNTFEKESVGSFTNIIGLSLDKSILYEELQTANLNLRDLLKQRESLVHLVTHKVKGSFTRSKYLFAGMLEGMFGDINEEIRRRAKQGLDSDNMGIETVDLVLNAANLQKGAIKYDLKKIDWRGLLSKVVSEKKISAEAKGLKIDIVEPKEACYVSGDVFWLGEAMNNLVENSIKYTLSGKITVGLEDRGQKTVFYVRDTGIGITEEDKKNLFTEGGRGKDSVKVNVDSTGYGLYSVRLIVDAHKGRVWLEPNTIDGKGSVFYIELDKVA